MHLCGPIVGKNFPKIRFAVRDAKTKTCKMLYFYTLKKSSGYVSGVMAY